MAREDTQAQLRLAILETLSGFGLGMQGNSGVVRGYALVVEWVDMEGARWLTQVGCDANGDEAPEWQNEGYFHNALHTPWPVEEDDDDD